MKDQALEKWEKDLSGWSREIKKWGEEVDKKLEDGAVVHAKELKVGKIVVFNVYK